MNISAEVYAQLVRETPIEKPLKAMTSFLFTKVRKLITTAGTLPPAGMVLGFDHLKSFMRNIQELHNQMGLVTENDRQIDPLSLGVGLYAITNSNPTASLLALKRLDYTTRVATTGLPAKSCNLDPTFGDPALIPLAVATGKGYCSDADYWNVYRPNPASGFEFYYNPLKADPTHCLFTHPKQLSVEDFAMVGDSERDELRANDILPFWERKIRLSDKVREFRIEV